MSYKIEHSIHLEFLDSKSEGTFDLWVPTPTGAKVKHSVQPTSSKELVNLGCTINYWKDLEFSDLTLKNVYTHSGIARTPPLSSDFIEKALGSNDPWIKVTNKIKDLPLMDEIRSLEDGEKVKRIKAFILSFIKYEYPPKTRKAEEVLEVGKSDCGGYHALFVAISRSFGIPAVLDFGFRTRTNQAHVWAWWYNVKSKDWIMEDLNDEQENRKPTDRVSLVLSTNPKLDPPYPTPVLFLQSHLIWIKNLDALRAKGFSFRHYPNWVVA